MVKLSIEQAIFRADALVRKGEFASARPLYELVLSRFPSNPRAKQGLAKIASQTSVCGGGEVPPKDKLDLLVAAYNQGFFDELIKQAEYLLADYPDSFLIYSLGAAGHYALGNFVEAESGFRKAVALNPAYDAAHYNLGNVLKQMGKLDDAIEAYRRTLQLKPADADAHYNLGIALKEQGKLDEAITAYKLALEHKPTYVEAHYNLGNVLKQQGKLDDAISAYQQALALKPIDADAHNNLGNAFKQQGKLDEAIKAYRSALALNPTDANGHNNLGNVLRQQGKLNEAISAYRQVLAFKPDDAEAHYSLGTALREQGELDQAISAFQKSLAIKPTWAEAEAQLLFLQHMVCDFSVSTRIDEVSARLGISTDAIAPFTALTWADAPSLQLQRSLKFAEMSYGHLPIALPATLKNHSGRIRIGYFSADFHNHATFFLMAGMLRCHDRTQFEVFCYSYGSKFDAFHEKIKQSVDFFFDVSKLSDQEIVDLSRSHEIDIAVDLKGYTQETRSSIFKYRNAPIQINYLGYPGTMGADFIDYIIADPQVIPEDQRGFYTESVIYLPHSYQPNDSEREIELNYGKRADHGLPNNSFVLCCFNNNYKITIKEFDIWMRLLKDIEGSVLWLLKGNAWARKNLRKEAIARGVHPFRLVFADRAPVPVHLARHKHADLFLDTFNVNAHTTASDALWAGLPVVTKRGEQFSARVAASLLTAVGIPELITDTEFQYEEKIRYLANNPKILSDIRRKLSSNRLTAPLFDTKRYTRNFEKGLRTAHQMYLQGYQPRDIWVADHEQ
jgi:protein O-GlcNAc transferase